MLNVRFLVNVTEAEHHDASISKETETLARSSREVLRTLRNTVDFGWVSPYKGEGKKSMIGTKWFVDDEVSNDMSSQCEFGVPVRHANETQVVGGNGVPMQSDELEERGNSPAVGPHPFGRDHPFPSSERTSDGSVLQDGSCSARACGGPSVSTQVIITAARANPSLVTKGATSHRMRPIEPVTVWIQPCKMNCCQAVSHHNFKKAWCLASRGGTRHPHPP
ncbi:hypothetical protein NDU88_005992 [Pleurodeles waltl]|uniref:Uncharacterized protein n=1 Tax=Pleurodeles waltl TaxID=8319 RepID=A0AAV7RK99_PLEWA|nr:hypothetical protein NDU88_005992 [Pleurodeles waltl]